VRVYPTPRTRNSGNPPAPPRMPAPMLDFKIAFLEGLLSQFGERPIRILDMGCGTAKDWPDILRSRPWVTYVGLEPDSKNRSVANELLHGLPAEVLAGWGEAMNAHESFDLTVSLSVLEHVKYLDPFLRASVAATRPGGAVVHRYDLGHSLYPATDYERLLVVVSRRMPWIVPASRFTSHLDPSRVARILSELGLSQVEVSYAQMYSLKQAMNRLSRIENGRELAERVLALDADVGRAVRPMVTDHEMAHLFPSVIVRGVREP
jgi:SAM-dependent methyltransferase